MPNIELYGTEGSLQVPDPNGTDGIPRFTRAGVHGWQEQPHTHKYQQGARGVGVADMAMAIRSGREHRANDAVALHAVDIMQAAHEAALQGRSIDLTSTCTRPQAMRADLPEGVLDA